MASADIPAVQRESGCASRVGPSALPAYHPTLSYYHRAFEPHLRAVLAGLPVPKAAHVLDAACGDGAYAGWFADRLRAHGGRVVAVDLSAAWLEFAACRSRSPGSLREPSYCRADLQQLPFTSETFDLVWCAQSLYSLPRVMPVLRELTRVTRQGGTVAVLENDSLHHVLFSWPANLELAIRSAEYRSLAKETEDAERYYVGRNLGTLLRRAGLREVRDRLVAVNLRQPLQQAQRAFLEAYLQNLWERIIGELPPVDRAVAASCLEPGSPGYLLDRADLSVALLDRVTCGRR